MKNEPLLALRNASRRYRADAAAGAFALEGITLEIAAGSWTAITGRSGAGKTTLLNLLTTLDRPDAGALWMFGRDVTRDSEGSLARIRRECMGIIPQGFRFIEHLTAWENVSVRFVPQGMSATERRARSAEVLTRLGVEHALDRLPRSLSGGEQQRVALARAAIARPRILIADEPTSSVDAETGEAVRGFLDELRAGGTAIVVSTHDPALVETADRVHVVTGGRLAS